MLKSEELVVLYIDSDHDIRERGASLIRDHGLRVFESSETAGGCELFRTHKIDIVIIDLDLPEESGTEFINCLHNKGVQSPIITTTTHTNEKKLFEAINLDITQYLMKPYTKNELYRALEVAINKVRNTYSLAYTSLDHGFNYDPVNKVINGSNGTVSHLSKKKYVFLELLLKNNKHIVPYDIIKSQVWADSVMTQNALRTLVRDIRKCSYNDIFLNYNGIGYKIDV